MSSSQLPERPSLEYLKKLAKDRLQAMRHADPQARLAAALHAVAAEHGFTSWRALKAEVDRRQSTTAASFVSLCERGDVDAVRAALSRDASLAKSEAPDAHHAHWSALHAAAKSGHADIVRLLLAHGSDSHLREAGDNTYPLHWAAAHAHLDVVQVLIDAGSDVHGTGDLHELDVIGWASYFRERGAEQTPIDTTRAAVIALLVEGGARHHIFSAICVGDLALIQSVVEHDPAALDRRMSRFERRQSSLHFALERKRHDILDLLIELGADVEATDGSGRTPMTVAMLSGDEEAMRRLRAAGATMPSAPAVVDVTASMAALAGAVKKGVPMLSVPDVGRTLDWYTSIGFTEETRYGEGGVVNFGFASFGGAQVMFSIRARPATEGVSLWFYTSQVDEMYRLLKARQLEAARGALDGEASAATIVFDQDIEDMFYGARQFAVRDPNGYLLYFISSAG